MHKPHRSADLLMSSPSFFLYTSSAIVSAQSDPHFLYSSKQHAARGLSRVRRRAGRGLYRDHRRAYGAGKTTVVRALAARLRGQKVALAQSSAEARRRRDRRMVATRRVPHHDSKAVVRRSSSPASECVACAGKTGAVLGDGEKPPRRRRGIAHAVQFPPTARPPPRKALLKKASCRPAGIRRTLSGPEMSSCAARD